MAYPEIKQEQNRVDACTMWFDKQSEYYDVIVTENLFARFATGTARGRTEDRVLG